MRTQVNIKLDTSIKERAQKRAKELGLSLSAVVNATLSQFARTGELQVSAAPKMTPFLEEMIEEAHAEQAQGKLKTFNTAENLIKDLEA